MIKVKKKTQNIKQPKWYCWLKITCLSVLIIIGVLLVYLFFHNLRLKNFIICDTCINLLWIGLAGIILIALPLIGKLKIGGVELNLTPVFNPNELRDIEASVATKYGTVNDNTKEELNKSESKQDFGLLYKSTKEVELYFKLQLKDWVRGAYPIINDTPSSLIILEAANVATLYSLLSGKYPELIEYIPNVSKIDVFFKEADFNCDVDKNDLDIVKGIIKQIIRAIKIEIILN